MNKHDNRIRTVKEQTIVYFTSSTNKKYRVILMYCNDGYLATEVQFKYSDKSWGETFSDRLLNIPFNNDIQKQLIETVDILAYTTITEYDWDKLKELATKIRIAERSKVESSNQEDIEFQYEQYIQYLGEILTNLDEYSMDVIRGWEYDMFKDWDNELVYKKIHTNYNTANDFRVMSIYFYTIKNDESHTFAITPDTIRVQIYNIHKILFDEIYEFKLVFDENADRENLKSIIENVIDEFSTRNIKGEDNMKIESATVSIKKIKQKLQEYGFNEYFDKDECNEIATRLSEHSGSLYTWIILRNKDDGDKYWDINIGWNTVKDGIDIYVFVEGYEVSNIFNQEHDLYESLTTLEKEFIDFCAMWYNSPLNAALVEKYVDYINKIKEEKTNKQRTTIESAKRVSQEQYVNLLNDHYPTEFVDNIVYHDSMAERTFGKKAVIESTGNLYVKYIETNNKIVVLGMDSELRKMIREDAQDMRNWITTLESKINAGKVMYTSINENSNRIVERLLSNNPNFKKKELGRVSFEQGEWVNIVVYKEGNTPQF